MRDADGTVLELDDARASTRARTKDAHFVFQNIGNGLGLNIRYSFRAINQPSDRTPMAGDADFHTILAGQSVQTVEPATSFTGEYEVVFIFESLGGRKYQTTLTMKNLVLKDFKFMPAPDRG